VWRNPNPFVPVPLNNGSVNTFALLCTGRQKLKPADQEMVAALRRKLDAAMKRDVMIAMAKPMLGDKFRLVRAAA
jgi:GH18 family chitinase